MMLEGKLNLAALSPAAAPKTFSQIREAVSQRADRAAQPVVAVTEALGQNCGVHFATMSRQKQNSLLSNCHRHPVHRPPHPTGPTRRKSPTRLKGAIRPNKRTRVILRQLMGSR